MFSARSDLLAALIRFQACCVVENAKHCLSSMTLVHGTECLACNCQYVPSHSTAEIWGREHCQNPHGSSNHPDSIV
jgi:hypothetical protein